MDPTVKAELIASGASPDFVAALITAGASPEFVAAVIKKFGAKPEAPVPVATAAPTVQAAPRRGRPSNAAKALAAALTTPPPAEFRPEIPASSRNLAAVASANPKSVIATTGKTIMELVAQSYIPKRSKDDGLKAWSDWQLDHGAKIEKYTPTKGPNAGREIEAIVPVWGKPFNWHLKQAQNRGGYELKRRLVSAFCTLVEMDSLYPDILPTPEDLAEVQKFFNELATK